MQELWGSILNCFPFLEGRSRLKHASHWEAGKEEERKARVEVEESAAAMEDS